MMKSILLLIVTVFLLIGCGNSTSHYKNLPLPLSLERNSPSSSTLNLDFDAVVCLKFTGDQFATHLPFRNGIERYFGKYAPKWWLECDNLPVNIGRGEKLLDLSVNVEKFNESSLIAEVSLRLPILTEAIDFSVIAGSEFSDDSASLSVDNYNLAILTAKSIMNQLIKIKEFSELVRINNEKYKLVKEQEQEQAEKLRKLRPEVSDGETGELYKNIIKSKHNNNKFSSSVEAYRLAVSNGYKPTHLPTFGTSLIVLDESKTGLFPMGSEDLPLEPTLMNRKEIKAILSKAEKFILVQPLQSIVKREILSQSKVQSKYISGHREQHNPAYDSVRRDYQRAQNEYNRVQAETSNQSSVGSLWWAQALTNGALVATASNALNNAQRKLAQTPQTTSIPIKQDYSYSVMEVKVTKSLNYNLYVIDKGKGKVLLKKYSKSADRKFKLQYDKYTEDTGYSTYDLESDVVGYEQGKLTFSVDNIVDDLIAIKSKEFKSKSYSSSLSFIESSKIKKRKAKAQKPKNINGKFSALMQSVVAIQDNGGSTIGTGFFINVNLILTNRHVVGERKLISVRTKGGQKYVGKVLDTHYDLDIALVEVDGTGIPVKIYSGSLATEGEEVIAIGNPIGLEHSVTKGIISSIRTRKDKKKPLSNEYRYIQTDVAINPGNSGGPLFMDGKVIGINTSKMVDKDIDGIGFAIHYEEILRYLEDNEVVVTKVKDKSVIKTIKKKAVELSEDKAEKKLTRLKKMFDKGLITEDEYKGERAEVLDKF